MRQQDEYSVVFLKHEDWPEWFTLDFYQGSGRKDPPRLLLGIAKEPLRRLVVQLPKYNLLDGLKRDLQAYQIEADFLLDVDRPWGFGGALEPFVRQDGSDTRSHLAEYSIKIPQIEKDIGKCEECDGKRKADGMDCLRCMGTGRKTMLEWSGVDCIAATLHVLGATLLDNPDKQLLVGLDSKHKQLLSVMTAFGRGRAFIGAVLSRSFGDYVRSRSEQELPEVKAAVKSAHLQMFPRDRRFGDFQFDGNFVRRNGQLSIDVPGNACGLYVDGMSRSLHEASEPMELNCHNVDNHHQQLTLLCGLAALAGAARKSLYNA